MWLFVRLLFILTKGVGVFMENPFKGKRDMLSALKSLRDKASPSSPRREKPAAPDGIFMKCPECGGEHTKSALLANLYVCPKCGYHHPIPAYYRLNTLLDSGSFHEINRIVRSADPLKFPGYSEKLALLKQKTGLSEAIVTATGKIDGRKAVFAVMDSRFLMGSMSAAVGEKLTRAVEHAAKSHLPLIIFSASGGARMQEGIFSLMQMAKTSAAIARFHEGGGLYISCFTHPTTGGVSASFASLGDITLAEPGALIGFAGPRVIEQTIGQKLPEDFQRSEYLEAHGFVDRIVERSQLRSTLSLLLRLHARKGVIR